jgi:hypothetical protein
MENNNLLVKINYTQEGNDSLQIIYPANSEKVGHSSKYLICGGRYNRNGGTIMFKAKNLEEAALIANNNLVANAGAIRYGGLKGSI